jgi:hypothetical protein
MTAFTIYDPGTGRILRSGVCQDCDAKNQAQQGEAVLVGIPSNPQAQKVDTTQTPPAIVGLPAVVATLADVQAGLLNLAASCRYAAETGGITVAGLPIATDDRSKLLLSAAYAQAQANPSFSVRWKTGAGSWATITAAQVTAAYNAVVAHVTACFALEASFHDQIMAAADIPTAQALQPAIMAFAVTT